MSRKCKNDKGSFCYTCGEFVFQENRKTIDEFYKKPTTLTSKLN